VKFFSRETPVLALLCLIVLGEPCAFGARLLAAEKPVKTVPGVSGKNNAESGTGPKISGLSDIVYFNAKDSLTYDLENRKMELRGKARLSHAATLVKAPRIVVDMVTEQLRAFGSTDSLQVSDSQAEFSDRNGSFRAAVISHDFRSGGSETSGVRSVSNGVFIKGEKVERRENGELEIFDGEFTTCDDADPHYWFSSSHLTIIPQSRIIARPFVMYVKPELFSRRLPVIPVLALPYMVFPIREGRSSGFLIPRFGHDYRGFYLSRFGYFWAISDYMDFRSEADISLNGSWRLAERFRYAKAGAFSGNVSAEYKSYLNENDDRLYRSWAVEILHNQEFDPTARLDINMNLQGGNRYYDLNSMNPADIVNEQSNSNVSLVKTFNDDNSILSAFYSRAKNLIDASSFQKVGASFYQNRMYPFRNKGISDWKTDLSYVAGASYIGDRTFLDNNSSFGYSANASFEIGLYRELGSGSKAMFTQGVSLQRSQPDETLYDDVYNGLSVMVPFRMQSTLYNYFNVNTALTFNHFRHSFDREKDFSSTLFSVDAGTRLYGTLDTGFLENIFALKALRHVFIPTISFSWNPAFSASATDYYRKIYDWTDPRFFSRFDNNIFYGLPEGQSSIGITLKNIFQGKFRASDTSRGEGSVNTEETRQLLSVTASTAYNFASESCPLEPLVILASSNALSPNLLLSAGSMYDFYRYDPVTGDRVDRLNSSDGRGLLRFVKGFLNMSVSIQGKRVDGRSTPVPTAPAVPLLPNAALANYRARFNAGDFAAVDYSMPWELKFSLYLMSDKSNPVEPAETRSLINVSAKTSLLRKWQVGFDTGYDFDNRELVFPMVQVYRDIHCWQVGLQVVPFGEFRSYSIQIGLKSPQLGNIRLKTGGSTKGWY
jgi:hypothetical protein